MWVYVFSIDNNRYVIFSHFSTNNYCMNCINCESVLEAGNWNTRTAAGFSKHWTSITPNPYGPTRSRGLRFGHWPGRTQVTLSQTGYTETMIFFSQHRGFLNHYQIDPDNIVPGITRAWSFPRDDWAPHSAPPHQKGPVEVVQVFD